MPLKQANRVELTCTATPQPLSHCGRDGATGFVRLTRRERADQRRSRLSRGEMTPFRERGSAVLLEDCAVVEVASIRGLSLPASRDLQTGLIRSDNALDAD